MIQCSVAGCGKKVVALGLCAGHWNRQRNKGLRPEIPLGGIDLSASKNGNWKGGQIMRHGRVMIFSPGHPFPTEHQYVYRYRLVMEKSLGRFLRPGEIVHHINGDKMDDRIENLKIMSGSEHNRQHMIGNDNAKGNKGWKNRKVHPIAKLTAFKVAEARSLYSRKLRNGRHLANKYGVAHNTIMAAILGKTWKGNSEADFV